VLPPHRGPTAWARVEALLFSLAAMADAFPRDGDMQACAVPSVRRVIASLPRLPRHSAVVASGVRVLGA
jgi:hypothetical protein